MNTNYYDYIGATGEHPINDYINITSNINYNYTSNSSNILNSNIIITSNILNSNIIITSNSNYNYTQLLKNELWDINSNNYNCIIKNKNYNNINHTYIINSNLNGEIRFSTLLSFSSTNDPINDYSVKIDTFGKLYFYHKFNLLQPTFPAGFYDLEGEIMGLKNQSLLFDGSITGLVYFQTQAIGQISLLQSLTAVQQVEIINLQQQVEMLGLITNSDMYLIQGAQNFETLSTGFNRFAQAISTNYANRLAVATTIGIGGAIPLILASTSDYMNREYYYRLASNYSNPNLPITDEQRRILYSCNDDPYIKNTSNYNFYTSNLTINQGFINCNIQTRQFIPSLNTNEIFINNVNINSNLNTTSNSLFNYTSNTSNYLINYNNLNNNPFINNTNLIYTNSNVGIGKTNPNYKLDVNGNINTNELLINGNNVSNIIDNKILITSNNNYNYTSNSSNYLFNFTSNNFTRISRVFIPNTSFVYDVNNNYYTYDLDISKYVNFVLVYGGIGNPIYFKTRIFRINSYMSTDWVNLDFNNKNHLSGNAICYPETLTIFMSNNKYYNNIHTAEENYCNGLILGKLNEENAGYWNTIPNNFNYIRFISSQGFDMRIIIEPLQN